VVVQISEVATATPFSFVTSDMYSQQIGPGPNSNMSTNTLSKATDAPAVVSKDYRYRANANKINVKPAIVYISKVRLPNLFNK